MNPQDFDFELPQERIAQHPAERGASRLLVVERNTAQGKALHHSSFQKLPDWLRPGDCLIVNDSKVIPARLFARKQTTGASIEILLHQEMALQAGVWSALARPVKRLHCGDVLQLGVHALEVVHIGEHGKIAIRFFEPQKTFDIIQENGVVPLPPYIKRQKTRSPGDDRDRETYQTVFAAAPGSVAAPTAGLHFSEDILLSLRQKGVRIGTVTLHVGWGTFGHLPQAPLEKIQLHKEPFILPEATAELCRQTKKEGGRIIACGTTSVRVLESAATSSGELKHGAGDTNLFIYPGYPWRLVDGILTNFHLPQSSLLMLVAAFWNWPELKNAYATAIRERYRFFSYGDAMLVL